MTSHSSDEGSPHTASESGTDNSKNARAAIAARLSRRRRPLAGLLGVLGLLGASTSGCQASRVTAPRLDAQPTSGEITSAANVVRSQALATAPARILIELGRSVRGVPLIMEVLGDGPDSVLIVAGIHGNEPTGAIVAAQLARFLESHPAFLNGRTVAIFAQANPDGLVSGRRTNANGVDLNRNFPATDWCLAEPDQTNHGPFSASEPETLAVMTAIEIIKPRRIVDIHSIERGHHGNNYDGSAEHLAELMGYFNGYPVLGDIGYATPGALGNWAGIDGGIPTVTLELPRESNGLGCWRENTGALLAFIGAHFVPHGR